MSAIEYVTVTCREQEDSTGSDDLHFYLDSSFLGRLTIETGETKTFDKSALIAGGDHILVGAGETLYVYEHDLIDPSDLLLTHTITEDELDSTITLDDQLDSADYSFEIKFIRF